MERIEIGGISLEAELAGTGPPLLFLHGGDYFAEHRAFLDRLAREWRVVAPRHPGFGASERPPWLRSVGDIAYLYLDLMERLDLREALAVGASFGGWVALEIAVRSSARIGRLVLIDSLGVKFGARDEAEIADIYALSAEEVVRRSFADPAKAPDYERLSDAEVEIVARDREAAVLYGWKPYMHNPSLVHWLHRVTPPTLVLWGDADRITEPSYGERLARAIPGARFAPVAAAGHYPQIETPDAVSDLIQRFAREDRR
jgi:pimeloyl-ACP methyl ester carboxylesterase